MMNNIDDATEPEHTILESWTCSEGPPKLDTCPMEVVNRLLAERAEKLKDSVKVCHEKALLLGWRRYSVSIHDLGFTRFDDNQHGWVDRVIFKKEETR